MPAPPGVVMVSPLEVLRNAERAQSEGRAKEEVATRRGQGQYKGRDTPKDSPARSRLDMHLANFGEFLFHDVRE